MSSSIRALVTLSTLALVAGCGTGASTGDRSEGTDLTVVTAFCPLQFAAEQIGGERAKVTSLTAAGAEPHDLELTPKQALAVQESSLVVYLKGFQPSVDAAAQSAPSAVDVSTAADLSLSADESTAIDAGEGHDHNHDHEGHDHGSADPHFWLDPTRYAKVVTLMGDRFAAKDPAHANEYRSRAAGLVKKLTALDRRFSTSLKACSNKNLVTSHTAFAYLADRYGLHQVGVSSISPDQEPTPARLKSVAAFVRANKVSTIYTETRASSAVADTVARETGAKVSVLDPLESITDKSAGPDYLSVMDANLNSLKAGQSCR